MKISVVLCTYNGAKYLRPQLESILQQSRPPDEILVCDDGSTDQTIEIVQAFARQHPTIHLIQNPVNLGFIRNFEQAIQRASGDVIFLSDQDDVWFPERVAAMMQPFEADPEMAMVYCNLRVVGSQLQSTAARHFPMQIYQQTNPIKPQHMLKTWGALLGCTMAVRASLRPLIFPIPAGWSHDSWLQIMTIALGRVHGVAQPLMDYRLHGNSSSGNLKNEMTFAQEIRIDLGRSKLKFYSDERIRWQNLVQRLREIQRTQENPFLNKFMPDAERREAIAMQREQMRLGQHWRRILPALGLLLRGDYHRYMRGFKTFAKDVLV